MVELLTLPRFALATLAACGLLIFSLPASSQQDQPIDPDASAVNEQLLLQQSPRIEGRIVLPDERASVLMQPAGRTWRYFHEVVLRWTGAIAIIGSIVILGIAYFVIGRLRIAAGRSGIKRAALQCLRALFALVDGDAFVVLAITGLNITFGKVLLLPLIGPEAFTGLSEAAK